MMELDEDQRSSLGVALNEADLLGFEVDPKTRVAAATFRILTLPEEGRPPEDPRVQFLFRPVGRVAASLRNGAWDDPEAEIVPFEIQELLEVVQSFGGQPIYGWEFFDVHEEALRQWGSRLSLNWRSGEEGVSHSICLFQDPGDRILDLCVWFDDFEIKSPTGDSISVAQFVAGGRRWWDGLHSGDPRTDGRGIAPTKGPAV
jgi:hypothetical protein